jgi:hypothetical protein
VLWELVPYRDASTTSWTPGRKRFDDAYAGRPVPEVIMSED